MIRFYSFLLGLACLLTSNVLRAQNIDPVQVERADSLEQLLNRTKDTQDWVMSANELSRVLQTVNEKQKGLDLAAKALRLSQKENYVKGIAASYASMGNAYREFGQLEKAYNTFYAALEFCLKTKYKKEEGFVYHNLGQIHWEQGDTARAIQNHQLALKVNEELKILNRQGFAHDHLGFIYVKKNSHEIALKHYKSSLQIFKKLNLPYRIALSAGNVGMINLWLGNKSEALEHFVMAAKNYELEKNTNGILWIYGLISNVYRQIHDYGNAAKYNQMILKLYQDVDSTRGVGDAYQLIGETYLEQSDYGKAKLNLTTALEIFETTSYHSGRMYANLRLAELFIKESNYRKAWEQVQVAEKIAAEQKNLMVLAEIDKLKGIINFHQGNTGGAKTHLQTALRFYKQIGAKQEFAQIYNYLAKTDSLQGDFKSAYLHYQQFIEAKANDLTTLSDTEKLALQFEFEKKEALSQAEIESKAVQRNLALGAIVLLVSLLVLSSMLFHVRRKGLAIEHENIELQRREYERIKETEAFKTRFLTNISHEFRTPLTLIKGHLEVLKNAGSNEEQRRYVEMENNGVRLLQLINQLLDLAKMDAGSYKLTFEPSLILEAANSLVKNFDSMAEEKEIDLQLIISPRATERLKNTPFIYSVEAFDVIMTNLLSNAMKFTPKGGDVVVEIDAQDDQVMIQVQDSGRGIADIHKEQIFDRFYQVEGMENHSYTGSGVGLALVKEMAILHGGSAELLDSHLGGSNFKVILANQVASQNQSAMVSPKENVQTNERAEKVIGQSEGEQSVLIVEDHAELRQFIVDNVGEGFKIFEAENGAEGYQLALEHVPDLIISDVMMPIKNGIEMCTALKEQVATSHIPIIFLTAMASEQDLLNGLMTGADDYVTKPFVLAELQLKIRNRLASQKKLVERYKHETGFPVIEKRWSSRDQSLMNRLAETVQENLSNTQFGVNDLADVACLSVSQLNRKLNALIGKSSSDFIRQHRLATAKEMLSQNESVTEVAWKVGYEDPIYFSKVFKKHFGCTPSSIKQVG